MLPQLLEKIPVEELLLTVISDGAYDTQPVHAAVIEHNATPHHSAEKERPDAQSRYLCASQCDHRRTQALWTQILENLEWLPPTQPSGDQDALHQAAGEWVMSRTFDRQVNELHIRAAILNPFIELGRPQTVAVA